VVPVGGATLAISKGIPQEKIAAAWKFIQWLNQPQQQLNWIKQTNYVPITRATNDLKEFNSYLLTEQGLDMGMRQLPTARPRPSEAGYVQGIQEIRKTLENIWLNNAPVEASMKDLVQRTQSLFKSP
jgi:sn-glycerol 3-phosphate transport system substrate-binding protein